MSAAAHTRGADTLGGVLLPSVIIQGVEPHMDEEAIRMAVTSLGHTPVKDLRLPRPRDPGADHKGYCFVDLYTMEAASRVVALLDGHSLAGQARRVRVSLVRERGNGPQAPGAALGLAAQAPELADADPDAVAEAALSAWQPKEFGVDQGDADAQPARASAASASQLPARVGTVAAQAGAPQGYTLDPVSGYFFDAASGYFYDSATGLYGHAATGIWYVCDAATGQLTAVTADSGAAPQAVPPGVPAVDTGAATAGASALQQQSVPQQRKGAVIGSAPKLSAEALALREEEQRRAAAAAAAAAAAPAPAAPVAVVKGGRVFGGKIRVPKPQ